MVREDSTGYASGSLTYWYNNIKKRIEDDLAVSTIAILLEGGSV